VEVFVHVLERPGPHAEVPQNEQVREALPGRRLSDGATSTLIVIYSPARNAWVFYLDSDPDRAMSVPVREIGPLVELLNGNGVA
jgi:hypothetical protein